MSDINAIIKIGVDTATNWATRTIQKGEIALIEEGGNLTGQFKIGDGTSGWGSLPMRSFSGISGVNIGGTDAAVADNVATFSSIPLTAVQGGNELAYTASVGASISGSWESGNNLKMVLKNNQGTSLNNTTVTIPITGIAGISYDSSNSKLWVTQSNGDKVSCSMNLSGDFLAKSWPNYLTSSLAGTASYATLAATAQNVEVANKLGTQNKGNATQSIYLSGGSPNLTDPLTSYATFTAFTTSVSTATASLIANVSNLSEGVTTLEGYFSGGEEEIYLNIPAGRAYTADTATSATSATTATKLSTSAGTQTTPVYFSQGKPVACTREIPDVSGLLPIAGGTMSGNLTVNAIISSSAAVTASGFRTVGDVYCRNVNATGDVTAGYTSDRRLKKDIEQISESEAEEVISSLNPVKFKWNEKAEELSEGAKTGEARGFIADEFLKVLPNAGRKIWDEYDAIYYEQVIPYLVAVVQKQQKEIEELKKIVNAGN